MKEEDAVDVMWKTQEDSRDVTVEALASEGAEIRERLGFEPVTAISLTIGVMALVRALVRLYRDMRYSGVMVDMTQDPVIITEMPGWSRREVLLVTSEGAERVTLGADESPESLVESLGGLLSSTE